MIIAKKNAAFYLSFPAIDSATPASYKSGVSPVDTAYSKTGAGAWASLAIADTATEIGTTGVYEIDLTAAEMNFDRVIIKFSVSGMADDAYQFDLRAKLTDDLQDVAATDIVSAGAITTLSGAVVNVDLVDTTTTNTDMRGTDSAALATALTTAQNDLDTITGTDGVTLATAQALYAPNKTAPDNAGIAGIQADLNNATDGLGAIKGDTAATLLDTDVSIPALIAGLNDIAASDILTTALVESYSADGTPPTLSQAIFLIQQFLFERATAGTAITIKGLDGTTTAAGLTLDSATTPTSVTRSS